MFPAPYFFHPGSDESPFRTQLESSGLDSDSVTIGSKPEKPKSIASRMPNLTPSDA